MVTHLHNPMQLDLYYRPLGIGLHLQTNFRSTLNISVKSAFAAGVFRHRDSKSLIAFVNTSLMQLSQYIIYTAYASMLAGL